MGFFNLVEQHYTVRVTTHFLGQLAALLVAHIARRRTHESGHIELLHIFAHVHADEGFITVEQELGKFLCQQGLAHAGRSQEHE